MTSTRTRGRGAGLTDADLETLTASLAGGKRVTVFLREPTPSLGLEAGASARVLSIDGTTVTVRPKGVDDQLPFEADELRTTRLPAAGPVRQRPAKTQPAKAQPAKPQPIPATPVPAVESAQEPVVPQESTTVPAAASAPVSATKAPRRPRAQPAAVSVTVTSAPDSTWTVVVANGTKKQGKATEVTADRVARAVRELGDEGAIAAVDEIIESARVAAQRRIAELSEELESARAALAQLESR